MLANKLIDLFMQPHRLSFVNEHTEQTKVAFIEQWVLKNHY